MLLLLGAIIIYHVIQKLHNMHVTVGCSVVYSFVVMTYIEKSALNSYTITVNTAHCYARQNDIIIYKSHNDLPCLYLPILQH